ncbi:MAG: MBL fold metallo-hydrolase [Chloroflexota bacterium]
MRLAVLGSCASQPGPGEACSGYLVSSGDSHVMLDCGSGTLGPLQRLVSLEDLRAIVVSHLHPDHYIDLVALRYGRTYGVAGARPIDVYLPPGGIDHLQRLAQALSSTTPFWDAALTLHEYDPGVPLHLGALTVRPHEVRHGIRSFGMRVEDGEHALAYSSDTVMCDELAALADGADTLLAEATLAGGAPQHHDPVTHLSAADAAKVAVGAGVRRLVLTHFWYTADRTRAVAEAREHFEGDVQAAASGLTLTL